ncbi:predicted protein [Nematostella vectensis]|uniref:G-protein coupled receptors family 1 profile domain-containing protein n=1 Tax=Nematostella vectensis TaxID=45351 RepID=A7RW16_NEMVE|nr:predicted protein [Nematostella vectensis]|eukprot:XP_001636397.1 predicted protein [Nematostella vectensis]
MALAFARKPDTNSSTSDELMINITDPHEEENTGLYLGLFVVELIICFVGAFGNTLTCLAVLGNKKLHVATNFYVLSLAIADLLVTGFLVPVRAAEHLATYQGTTKPRQNVMEAAIFVGRATILASFANLAALSIDRFLALKFPIQYRTRIRYSTRITLSVIVTIWVVSIFLTSIPEYSGVSAQHGLIIFVNFVIIMTVIICVANWQVFRLVKQLSVRLRWYKLNKGSAVDALCHSLHKTNTDTDLEDASETYADQENKGAGSNLSGFKKSLMWFKKKGRILNNKRDKEANLEEIGYHLTKTSGSSKDKSESLEDTQLWNGKTLAIESQFNPNSAASDLSLSQSRICGESKMLTSRKQYIRHVTKHQTIHGSIIDLSSYSLQGWSGLSTTDGDHTIARNAVQNAYHGNARNSLPCRLPEAIYSMSCSSRLPVGYCNTTQQDEKNSCRAKTQASQNNLQLELSADKGHTDLRDLEDHPNLACDKDGEDITTGSELQRFDERCYLNTGHEDELMRKGAVRRKMGVCVIRTEVGNYQILPATKNESSMISGSPLISVTNCESSAQEYADVRTDEKASEATLDGNTTVQTTDHSALSVEGAASRKGTKCSASSMSSFHSTRLSQSNSIVMDPPLNHRLARKIKYARTNLNRKYTSSFTRHRFRRKKSPGLPTAEQLSDRLVAKTLALVIGLFVLLVWPRICLIMFHIWHKQTPASIKAKLCLKVLVYTNSILNPGLYAWRLQEFRAEFKKIFARCFRLFKCGKRNRKHLLYGDYV